MLDAQGPCPPSSRATQVFEDGKPQEVKTFSLVNVPVERTERPLFASPITRHAHQSEGANGRILPIVLDDLAHGRLRSPRVKRRPTSSSKIRRRQRHGGFSGRGDAAQDFTNSQR